MCCAPLLHTPTRLNAPFFVLEITWKYEVFFVVSCNDFYIGVCWRYIFL